MNRLFKFVKAALLQACIKNFSQPFIGMLYHYENRKILSILSEFYFHSIFFTKNIHRSREK